MGCGVVNPTLSQDLFVNEYRGLLADRLLNMTEYDTDKEVCWRTSLG